MHKLSTYIAGATGSHMVVCNVKFLQTLVLVEVTRLKASWEVGSGDSSSIVAMSYDLKLS